MIYGSEDDGTYVVEFRNWPRCRAGFPSGSDFPELWGVVSSMNLGPATLLPANLIA